MIKNVVLGVVLASISAGLVYGAVVRTEARENVGVAEGGQYSGRGGGRRITDTALDDLDTDVERYSNGFGSQGSAGMGSQNGRGNGKSRGAGQSGQNPLELSLAEVDEVNQYGGVVEEVNEDYLIVLSDDGKQIVIENRAWWYALDAGFSASSGDIVDIIGFYDEDEVFEVISIENLTQSIYTQVREESGRPLWAGGAGR